MNSDYKILQVASFFMADYGYRRLMVNGIARDDEYYIVNKDNPYYQLIRISFDSVYDPSHQSQMEDIAGVVAKTLRLKNLQVLDIRISNDEVPESIKEGLICMEENHYSGEDLSLIYPGFNNCIHTVEDMNKERKDLERKINKAYIDRTRKNLLKMSSKTWVTYGFIILCVINFIIRSVLVSKGYSESAVEVFVGADYKTFTFGIGQYWRLITYCFVHGSILHLLCNMYSMFLIGRFIEDRYGSLRFAIILFGSSLCGALTYGLLNTNGIIVGLSGGLYGLLAIYFLEIILTKKILNRSVIYILFLNLLINFIPNVGWECHLGGFVFGAVCYFMFRNGKLDRSYAMVAMLVLLVLGFKYVQNDTVNPIYAGTDLEVVKIENEVFGEQYASKTLNKLNELYVEEGMYE